MGVCCESPEDNEDLIENENMSALKRLKSNSFTIKLIKGDAEK